jgi:hypothetical protein
LSPPPTEDARSRAVLKIVIPFRASISVRPRRTKGRRALRLAYWNVEGVSSKNVEPEQLLCEHGDDICVQNETCLQSILAMRFTNHVCHRADNPTQRGKSAIIFRGVIDHNALPVWGMQHLEVTAIHLVFKNRPDFLNVFASIFAQNI